MAIRTRAVRAIGIAIISAVAAASGGARGSADPLDQPELPIEFAAGTVCADTIRFENLSLNAKDTAFARPERLPADPDPRFRRLAGHQP